jgi:uncharacterized protein (DUF1499 family)
VKNNEKAAARSATSKKKAAIFGAAVLAALFALSRTSPPTNIARTSQSDADQRLHPRLYPFRVARVAQEIRALVPRLRTYGKTWKIADARSDAVILRIEVPVLIFTDDFTVTLSPQNDGASTRVEVRSASRVGKGDFGENRRHIVQFLTALDARFE